MTESLAVVSDIHAAGPLTRDAVWNNALLYARSLELLDRAIAQIRSAGLTSVLVLGDISQHGDIEYVDRALRAFAAAGLEVWAVAGNHDVAWNADTVDLAADDVPGVTVLQPTFDHIVAGTRAGGQPLSSADGGQLCTATAVPDPGPATAGLLLWATHYPVLSRAAAVGDAGLRYPGDLLNLADVQGPLVARTAPVLVLHGHLHVATVTTQGTLLQLGVPALVEWPHAWTTVTIGDDGSVGSELHPVAPEVERTVDTMLAAPVQSWRWDSGTWSEPAQ
jgi:3',5'-cyclic AMP phosphodiesterase CpdA